MVHSVAIWGSCVSRDSVESANGQFSVLSYTARQSWISSGSDASVFCPPIGDFSSPFQRRMTVGDLEGNALGALEVWARSDILLLDLCDERHGVVKLLDGSVITRTVEKLQNGSQEEIDLSGTVLPFGSEEHLLQWARAGVRIVEALLGAGLLSKTLLLAPDWASTTEDGSPSPDSYGLSAGAANAVFPRYYAVAASLGLKVIRFDGTLGLTTHKWGAAPFHYDDATYARIVEAILQHVP